ncbi:MAG: Smr/MutS family protein [Ectothiorhodospiraceae bacterium]|nr:Smr/MutS family protein [Ectothiorhodospiraceae bacterium]
MANNKKTNNDDALFREMMEGVKPLPDNKSGKGRVPPLTPPRTPAKRRKGQLPTPEPTAPFTHPFPERDFASEITADETLFFVRSGLQHREQRRLKRGEFHIDASLDLHGDTIEEAGHQLDEFLRFASASGLRCVHIIHGKGHRSTNGHAAIKSQLNQWLRDTERVLAFCSAQKRHGGTGAVYVLLRRGPSTSPE